MYEKVSMSHPDKVADRIAGALVDLAYQKHERPRIAAEVLIGHGRCTVILETSEMFDEHEVASVVERIAGAGIRTELVYASQDRHLARNQEDGVRCGDNGIFKGMPVTMEEKYLAGIARGIYADYPTDGKYIVDYDGENHTERLIICQSHAKTSDLKEMFPHAEVNPLGDWTGGLDVDSGATNRKLGSDMAQSVTGGGLWGKDLSKADVSVNIYAFLKAQETGKPVELCCAIGDETVDGKPYSEIVDIAKAYIERLGGFEKFAEWGLVR